MFRFKTLALLLLIFLSLSVSLYSQSYIILDVRVVGNERINRDLILATSSLRIGDSFTPDMVSNAIRNLYNLAVFNDVNIEVEEINRGLRFTIIVDELPVIRNIRFEGNKAVNSSRMDELTILRIGSYWSPIVQSENTRRLLAEYRSKGFNLAEINYSIRETEEGLDIRVQVSEGRRLVVRDIVFAGNNQIEASRLHRQMKTKRRSFFRTGRFENEKFQEDIDLITQFYHNEGFIDARVLRTEEDITDNRNMTLTIFVEEGERFYFGSVRVTGNHHFTDEQLLSLFSFRENDIFNMDSFNKQMQAVASMYFEEGYIYSNYDPQINRIGNKVNVLIIIDENSRAKLHKIHITGNTRTKEKIIRRHLAVAPGDYFRQSRVIRSQQNIYNLGLFDPNIGLDYMPINAEGDVDLYLNIEDKTSGVANGGLGYNSRDSMVWQLSVSHNNLFGNNWQTNIAWEYSGSNQNIEIGFTNPYLFDTSVLFGFNIYHTQRDWIDSNFRLYTNGAGLRLGYPIKAIDHSRAIGGYSLYAKRYEIRNMDRAYSPTLLELHEERWKYTSSFNLTLSRDSRDNIFFPTSGSTIALYNEIAGGFLGGDFNYFKQIGEVRWFTPAVWTSVLRTKWRYGFITGYGDDDKIVPPDERFFLGGTGVDGIRGYPDRSIGPIDGGSRSILFSTELGVPITSDQIVGLMFFDAGNSFNSFTDFNFKDFNNGAGLGIRVRTPIGLLGFDYAYSFRARRWEPHFQLGTTF